MAESLKTLGNIKTEFLVRQQTSTTVAFYSEEILNKWADQAHKRAASYKKWPFTEGRVSTTYASLVTDEDGLTVGEYPEGWRSDSIRMLQIGGKSLAKKEFYSFRKFVEEQPDNEDRIFSDFGRRFYVRGSDLSGTVAVWGQFTPASFDFTDPDQTTVFSSGEVEGNEAIVELMLSFAADREKKAPLAKSHREIAKEILDGIWERVGAEQFNYGPTDGEGMWKRIDVVGGGYHEDSLNTDQFI